MCVSPPRLSKPLSVYFLNKILLSLKCAVQNNFRVVSVRNGKKKEEYKSPTQPTINLNLRLIE